VRPATHELWICSKSTMMDVISGARTANPSRVHPSFSEFRVAQSLVFCVVFCM
jgi:hypothetical protein